MLAMGISPIFDPVPHPPTSFLCSALFFIPVFLIGEQVSASGQTKKPVVDVKLDFTDMRSFLMK